LFFIIFIASSFNPLITSYPLTSGARHQQPYPVKAHYDPPPISSFVSSKHRSNRLKRSSRK
jgi:hypothetical protein